MELTDMQNQTISELYTDDEKSKYSSNPNDILKTLKNFYEKLYAKETTSKTATAKLFSKMSNQKKISNEHFHHCEAIIFLETVTKSINSQTYHKSSGNNSLQQNFIKTFQMNYLLPF